MSHIEAAHQAIEKIKQFGSTLDGWTFHSENKGIKIYTQEKEKGAMPAVRGEGILEGYTVHQIAAVAESIGCRPLWDGRFGGAERIEFLQDNTFIFWNSNKGIWPVSDRDLCGVSTFETSPEGTYYSGLTSVVDSRVPEKKGAVRADLHIGGWIIQPEGENSVKATYIIDIDLKGSIPGALVRKVSIDTPLCVAHVFEFLKKYGNPPYLTGLKDTSIVNTSRLRKQNGRLR
ncbi:hypothetical protein K7432_006505 [Basidiobolus ranarum]|uniref:START domain-containing protein n=1 Tax=Basidiobolus ranarum TaxID=34480 RepID=A0ABR2W1H0_9FUNG